METTQIKELWSFIVLRGVVLRSFAPFCGVIKSILTAQYKQRNLNVQKNTREREAAMYSYCSVTQVWLTPKIDDTEKSA